MFKSDKQKKLILAAAHNKEFDNKVGFKQSAAKKFMKDSGYQDGGLLDPFQELPEAEKSTKDKVLDFIRENLVNKPEPKAELPADSQAVWDRALDYRKEDEKKKANRKRIFGYADGGMIEGFRTKESQLAALRNVIKHSNPDMDSRMVAYKSEELYKNLLNKSRNEVDLQKARNISTVFGGYVPIDNLLNLNPESSDAEGNPLVSKTRYEPAENYLQKKLFKKKPLKGESK